MVLSQVGEGRHLIVNTAHPFQRQGMGGHLHNRICAAGIPHACEQSLQFKALGRSALGGDDFVTDAVIHSADQADLRSAHSLQNMLEKQRYRGLAVGSGDADHRHGTGGIAIEIPAQQRQGKAGVFHQNIRHTFSRSVLGNYRRGTLFQGHGDKPVAVGGKAGDGNKQAAGDHLPGVVGHGPNLGIDIHIGFQYGNVPQ